jgi:hypothetical protein
MRQAIVVCFIRTRSVEIETALYDGENKYMKYTHEKLTATNQNIVHMVILTVLKA